MPDGESACRKYCTDRRRAGSFAQRQPKSIQLQKGLLFLVLRPAFLTTILQQGLASELRTQTFGDATAELSGIWQNQMKNWPDYLPVLPKCAMKYSYAEGRRSRAV
jgi:hypothetical protein